MNDSAVPPIGQRLREARVERGISVRGLARAVDVSPSLISQIETGKSSPSVSTLYAITTALQISIEDVFGDPATAGARAGGPATGVLAGAERGREPAPALAAAEPVATAVPAGAAAGPPGLAPARALPGAVVGAAGPLPDAVVTAAGPLPGARPLAETGTPAVPEIPGTSVVHHGLRMLANQRRVGPVVRAAEREVLQLDSGVTWELLGQLPHTHVDFLRITYAPGGSSSGAGVLMRHSGTEYGHVLSGQLTLNLGFDTYVLNPGDSVSFDCSTPHAYANHGTEPAVGVWWVLEHFA